MLVVAVISRKGGVGKSTIAVHLAVEAAKAGPVAVVDLDVQASAAGWGDSRTAEQPAIVTCPPTRLVATLDAAKRAGALVAIIDTAPHAEAPALAAARASDLMLIVTRPGILDLRAIGQSTEIAQLAGKPAAVVINAAPAVGSQASEAAEAVSETWRGGVPSRGRPAGRLRARPGERPDGRRDRARWQGGGRDYRALAVGLPTRRHVDTSM
jgi:chromosome partitioning protein